MSSKISQKGYGIVEIIITLSMGMILLFGIDQFLNLSLRMAMDDIKKTEALNLAKSSLEQARAVRDEDWTNISGLTLGSHYHFDVSASPEKWITASGDNTVGRYTVWIVTSSVNRDNISDDIVSSGGSLDANTIRVDSYVSWISSSGAQQISLFEYLTNYK